MKSFIMYSLLFTLPLQVVDCYSFYPLEKNENIKRYKKSGDVLNIRLKMKILLVIAATLLIHGCSHYDIVKINKAEFLDNPGDKISKVVLESGEFIQFNNEGGSYYNLNNCIAGLTWEDGFTIIPLTQIDKVQLNWGNIPIGRDPSSDTSAINSVLLKDGKTVIFRKYHGGGKYYKDNKSVIAGIDTGSKHYQISVDKISSFDIYKLDLTKTIISNILLGGAAAFIVYAIYNSTIIRTGPTWNFF